jgi:RNase P subunit RPR2
MFRLRRAKRLPWLRCLHCLNPLMRVDVFNRMTAVRVQRAYSWEAFSVVCPRCGTVRKFSPRPID